MKKLIYGLLGLVIVAGALVYIGRDSFAQPLFNREGGQAETITGGEETLLPPVKAAEDVIVEAIVVPARQADLSMAANGIVREVLVNEGDTVSMGTPLVQLANARQQAAVAQDDGFLSLGKKAQADGLVSGAFLVRFGDLQGDIGQVARFFLQHQLALFDAVDIE